MKILNVFLEIGENEEFSEFVEIPLNSEKNKEILTLLSQSHDDKIKS